MFNKPGLVSILVVSALMLFACAEEAPEPLDRNAADVSSDGVMLPSANIFDTAVAVGSFTTLVSALQTTGLDTDLADESKTFTVFAPTDAAFEKLGSDTVNEWFANPEAMQNLLQYHLLPDTAIESADAVTMIGNLFVMANGENVTITHDGNSFYINSSEIIVTDVMASNGVIHVIDTVLDLPVTEPSPTHIAAKIASNGTFTVLHQALVATGLADTLSNMDNTFTVFAPTDEAFARIPDDRKNALLADIQFLNDTLLYHVINGDAIDKVKAMSLSGQQKRMANGHDVGMYLIDGILKINEATVTDSEIVASNGVIHSIDSVLTSPMHSVDSPYTCEMAVDSIFDIAQKTPDYSMFAHAVEVANFNSALGCPIDMYTVFIPTNAAFKALSQSTRDRLFADPAAMREVVLMHVLPGRVLDSSVAIERLGFELQAGNGRTLVMSQQADTLWVEDAKILTTDITSLNGVVHTIDKVLRP